jgi:hypothetical protein
MEINFSFFFLFWFLALALEATMAGASAFISCKR